MRTFCDTHRWWNQRTEFGFSPKNIKVYILRYRRQPIAAEIGSLFDRSVSTFSSRWYWWRCIHSGSSFKIDKTQIFLSQNTRCLSKLWIFLGAAGLQHNLISFAKPNTPVLKVFRICVRSYVTCIHQSVIYPSLPRRIEFAKSLSWRFPSGTALPNSSKVNSRAPKVERNFPLKAGALWKFLIKLFGVYTKERNTFKRRVAGSSLIML